MKNEIMMPVEPWSTRAHEEFMKIEDYMILEKLQAKVRQREDDIARWRGEIHDMNQEIRALKGNGRRK